MNIYEKLCDARLALQGLNLKKSGNRNKMKYYELADFLPSINAICKEQGILPIVSFTEQSAKMTIVNLEKPEEKIEIESPFGSANLPGCHSVQNIGAVETYQRRYLYMVAFEIVESDILDGQLDEKAQKPEEESPPEVICPMCGLPITPIKSKGKVIPPEEVLGKLGMCYDCYKQEKAEAEGQSE